MMPTLPPILPFSLLNYLHSVRFKHLHINELQNIHDSDHVVGIIVLKMLDSCIYGSEHIVGIILWKMLKALYRIFTGSALDSEHFRTLILCI
jgi:hypothetical protein